MLKSLSVYKDINIIKLCFYGFMSGMGLLLSGNSLNFWLATKSIDPKIIGLFSFIALPYGLKYFIALFLDHCKIHWIEKHLALNKFWLILSQFMIASALFGLSLFKPDYSLWIIALLGGVIALFVVIQDIILDAKRVKILKPNDLGPGSAMYTMGYRFGMLFSGAGVIFLSIYLDWSTIFLGLAFLYCIIATINAQFYNEPNIAYIEPTPSEKTSIWYNMLIKPFHHVGHNLVWIILFVIIYRLSDNMLVVMVNPFLLKIGYNTEEIATISKLFGTAMVIFGCIISGPIIAKYGTRRCLISFSIIHLFGHILFIILAVIGKNIVFLYFLTAYEALTGGMVMTIYISFLSGLCKGKYVATQYALISSCIGLSRVLFPVVSGWIVDYYGWLNFFIIIACISILCVLFIQLLPRTIYQLDEKD